MTAALMPWLCQATSHVVSTPAAGSSPAGLIPAEPAARHAPTGQHSLVHQARLMDPLADRAVGSCSVAALDSIEPRGWRR